MCMVSMVFDGARRIPPRQWTVPAHDHLQQILDLARRVDELTGQKDCVDPEKAKVLERIEQHLKTLSERVGKLERKPRKVRPRAK